MYTKLPDFNYLTSRIEEYARVADERGADPSAAVGNAEKALTDALDILRSLPPSDENLARQPSCYNAILSLRPDGPRRIWKSFDEKDYRKKIEGALLGRMAGCTLGAPVEFWEIDRMKNWAGEIGDNFPNTDYWAAVPEPYNIRYNVSKCGDYTRTGMDGVPVDDDVTYTILGLLIAEEYGIDFSTDDVARAWIKYLPMACTAEDVALKAIKNGIPASEAAEADNPYLHWIGADIRADPFGYMAPGYPELAAKMAYRDAYLSHRQNGIYGEMLFSAAIAAAFTVDNAVDAFKIGLTEIPHDCDLTRDINWAFDAGKSINNYRDARDAVEARFKGMSGVHTNNNACLTLFGLMIGNGDFSKAIGETVAMGLDNDCNAATVGSIAGILAGPEGIPGYWTHPFKNTVHTYFFGNPDFKIDDLMTRFTKQARKALL